MGKSPRCVTNKNNRIVVSNNIAVVSVRVLVYFRGREYYNAHSRSYAQGFHTLLRLQRLLLMDDNTGLALIGLVVTTGFVAINTGLLIVKWLYALEIMCFLE